ncbi:hypothetical protein Bbelb_052260 [Branchiostoma belcheri]|nr:hypothetical protein Bbelb_052260 [Branchiostoma belcheri]
MRSDTLRYRLQPSCRRPLVPLHSDRIGCSQPPTAGIAWFQSSGRRTRSRQRPEDQSSASPTRAAEVQANVPAAQGGVGPEPQPEQQAELVVGKADEVPRPG